MAVVENVSDRRRAVDPMPVTYRDGVGVERFRCCLSETRLGQGWDCEHQQNELWFAILMRPRRDLTRDEFLAVIPRQGRPGSIDNRVRASRLKMLRNRRFTVGGKKLVFAKLTKRDPLIASR